MGGVGIVYFLEDKEDTCKSKMILVPTLPKEIVLTAASGRLRPPDSRFESFKNF